MKRNIQTIENEIDEINLAIIELDKRINSFTKFAWVLVWFGATIFILGFILYFFNCINLNKLNELGDFYSGTVTSLWSLSALFFIYVAFLGQKQQLNKQSIEIMQNQIELRMNREEQQNQRKEMKKHNETLEHQRFENTFFQLLRQHNDIINSIDLRRLSRETLAYYVYAQGRDCFKIFYDEEIKKKLEDVYELSNVMEKYEQFYKKRQSDLSHYFKSFYHILKFIKRGKKNIDKNYYASLLRAQASNYELILIFYNGISVYGKEKLKPLLKEYNILKSVPEDLIFHSSHHNEYK